MRGVPQQEGAAGGRQPGEVNEARVQLGDQEGWGGDGFAMSNLNRILPAGLGGTPLTSLSERTKSAVGVK